MKSMMKKVGMLAVVLLLAVAGVYFATTRNTTENESVIYTAITEPTLPVAFAKVNDTDVNEMHGYLVDMGNAGTQSTTPLPEDRNLAIHVKTYGNTVTGVSYEIRNLTLDRLVEQTKLENWDNLEDGIQANLPIQNLIARDEPYLLTIFLDTEERQIRYYTKIVWPQDQYAQEMLALAEEFSRKSTNYTDGQDLTSYLETSATEDNSNLAKVTIRTSFAHLTWDGLDVQIQKDPVVTFRELDGRMGQLSSFYTVSVTDRSGKTHTMDVQDNYAMRWNEQRIYLMDYERRTNEQFTGASNAFSSKRIVLGVTGEEQIAATKSPSKNFLVFQTGRELWSYDQSKAELVRIFSFLSGGENEDDRNRYAEHSVRTLSVDDSGNVTFLVYGYMNRGPHEGLCGVSLCRFNAEDTSIAEEFFLPAARSPLKVMEDVESLSYISSTGVVYLLLDGNVYAVDTTAKTSNVVAQGLTQGSYGVSADGSILAWQDGGDPKGASVLHVMNFSTGVGQDITGNDGDYVRVLGFVGTDLVYGLANTQDVWAVNGRVREYPMYAMYIISPDQQIETQYEKSGVYLSDVVVGDGRIHMSQLAKTGEQSYTFQNKDTIVCNEKFGEDPMEYIGSLNSQDLGKVYFVRTDQDLTGVRAKRKVPETFSYEPQEKVQTVAAGAADGELNFSAYALGAYLGSSKSFTEAVSLAYDHMGVVTDQNGRLVWDRINRKTSVNIKEPATKAASLTAALADFSENQILADGMLMVDARGCTLNQVLYFIDKGVPVAAYVEGGSYVLLVGYDQYNVTLYNPQTQETWKMGLGDGAVYFENLQNDFVCGRY